MSRAEIFKIAKSVGMAGMAGDVYTTESELIKFVEIIIAKEREACAQLLERSADSVSVVGEFAVLDMAKAIRARGDA